MHKHFEIKDIQKQVFILICMFEIKNIQICDDIYVPNVSVFNLFYCKNNCCVNNSFPVGRCQLKQWAIRFKLHELHQFFIHDFLIQFIFICFILLIIFFINLLFKTFINLWNISWHKVSVLLQPEFLWFCYQLFDID